MAKTQKGKDAIVPVTLTCPEPIAGFWLNIRHSPRLEFWRAELPDELPARFTKSEGYPDHSRHLVSFTTDAATWSAEPGTHLVQIPPETVIIRLHMKCAITLEAGFYPMDAGRSGVHTEGHSVSWPTLLLNWGSGGIEPEVLGGGVEVE